MQTTAQTMLEFRETVKNELSPKGILETTLATEIACAAWRLRTATGEDPNTERTRTRAHTILHRCFKLLRQLQAERGIRFELSKPSKVTEKVAEKPAHAVVAASCEPEPAAPVQTPRNALCPCNSGQKYKRCCGRTAPALLSAPAPRRAA